MLKRTKDRKVTNSVTAKGNVRIANAFSLPAITSCPGATDYCKAICYAFKLEKAYPSFHDVAMHNYNTLVGLPKDEMVTELYDMMQAFVNECLKWNAPMYFRIHADGDFFSKDYLSAWMNIIWAFPEVQFWVYTRDPEAAFELHFGFGMNNCTVYFSADPDNMPTADRLHRDYGIRIAMLADTFADAREMMGDIKAVNCPENNKAIPLIDSKGSACARCGLCIHGRNNVLFSKGKK